MQKHHLLFAMTTLFATSFAAQAQAPDKQALTEPQVRTLLTEKGYKRIDDLDFEKGMWEADATSADGNRVYLRIPADGSSINAEALVSNLSVADVKAKLSAAGYSKVHDVDFDDGVWEADATNAQGQKVELRIDPTDGKVLAVEHK